MPVKSNARETTQAARHATPTEDPEPMRSRRPPIGPFLLAALAAVAGLIGTYLFFVRTTTGQFIDESALVEATELYGTAVKASLRFLDFLPAISAALGAGALGYAAIVRRRWAASLTALAAAGAANLATQVLKNDVFTRPYRGIETFTENSLPSGHTTLAASAAAAIFLVSSPRWRPFVAFAGATYAVGTGIATLVNQWHRPADIVAAFLVVAVFMAPAAWVVLITGRSWNAWEGFGSHPGSSRLWVALPTLAGLGAAAVAVVALVRIAPLPGQEASTTNYFWAGCAFVAISGYLVSVAASWLVSAAARRT
ncbi:phosphatase PAP2 family protein [Sinomonas sp. ASV486]|uniref:phosphatase PAP2 family protein n=1 Tax=Sinomonas sp. ASV486 TaxID=3051170 RepID=UPI0027DE48AC|nr:phosphatase PAP2 family protein [Sinomonas sp. ASV486]MDQ4488608.1 phosphatase PAP2 family protein [Sinomonas sp. ASV486]